MSDTSRNISISRESCQVLVVCQTTSTSTQVRSAIRTLGFTRITTAPTHTIALDRAKSRGFQLILFETQSRDIPTVEFVSSFLKLDSEAVLIAISSNPQIDDVFSLLKNGSRGFVVPPFSLEGFEEVIHRAFAGPLFNEEVLNARDRNGALVGVILNNLYKTAVAKRQSRNFDTAKRDYELYKIALAESVELGLMFCEGESTEVLVERIVEACIARSNGPASRLGRCREKLKKDRNEEEQEVSMSE